MSKITIVDLEVFYCVGVSDEERATPQRLLLTVDMDFDFASAVLSDRITKTSSIISSKKISVASSFLIAVSLRSQIPS